MREREGRAAAERVRHGAVQIALVGALIVAGFSCREKQKEPPEPAALQIEDEAAFTQTILENKGLCLVDFYADWCPHCQRLDPVINELATELAGRVTIAKINIDNVQSLAQRYEVKALPHLMLFKSGGVAAQKTGFMPKEELASWIAEFE